MPRLRWPKILCGALVLLLPSGACHACEPIVVWIIAAGPQFIHFNLIALVLIVLAKAGAFPFFERRIGLWQAFLLMLLANVFSSLIGMLVAGVCMNPFFFPVSIPVLCLVCWFVGKRLLTLLGPDVPGIGLLMLAPFMGVFITGFIYIAGRDALTAEQYAEYWMLKILSLIFPLVVGLMLTTLLEEWVIGKRVKQITEGFLMPVFKANLVAFLLGGGIGAALMLPKRLHSPGFLAMVMDFLPGWVV